MKHILKDFNVCPPAVDWVGDRTVEEYVNECPKGEWMLWIADRLRLDKRKIALASGLCAKTVKHLMTDERSFKAVEGAIAYGKEEIDEEELETLRKAASSAAKSRKTNEKQTADICREVFGEWLIQELKKQK